MMTMSPNLISLFHSDLFYVLGDVCFYSAIFFFLVVLLVMLSRHLYDMLGSGVLLISIFSPEMFILIGQYHVLSRCYDETIHD